LNKMLSEIIKEIDRNIREYEAANPSLFILRGLYRIVQQGYDAELTLELIEQLLEEYNAWL